MKRIPLAAVTLMMLGGSAVALTPEEIDIICKSTGELSQEIMALRQAEMPMSQVMGAFRPEPGSDASLSEEERLSFKIAQTLIEDAYSVRAMLSPENAERQRKEFRNKAEVGCYKELRSAM